MKLAYVLLALAAAALGFVIVVNSELEMGRIFGGAFILVAGLVLGVLAEPVSTTRRSNP